MTSQLAVALVSLAAFLSCFVTPGSAVRRSRFRSTSNRDSPTTLVVPGVKCFFVINGEFTFYEAKQACEARGASLATLKSLSEDQFIRSEIDWEKAPGFRRNTTWIGQLWLGLERISPEPWKWIDGTPLRFSSWLAGEGNTSIDDHECIITRKFGWINSYHCDATIDRRLKFGVGALCQRSVFTSPTAKSEAGDNFCGAKMLPNLVNKFSMPIAAKKTFFTIRGSYTWTEARWACNSRGASLASLRTEREDNFVRQFIDIEDVGGNVWISLRRMQPDSFEWLDGTPASYTPWHTQESLGQMPEVVSPNCTVLKTWQTSKDDSDPKLGWTPLDCSADLDSTKNWPGGPNFPIAALCEGVSWF